VIAVAFIPRVPARLPHVTVVVPVKDRRDQMLRCLDALLFLEYPHFDVLVADNGSTDGTPDVCRARGETSDVDVQVSHFDGSLAAVRNAASRHARGEILAFTDSDCLPDRDWLRAAVRRFTEDRRVGVVCGRTAPEHRLDGLRWPATRDIGSFSGRYEGCNLLARREVVVDTSGFSERLGFFWEDTAAGFAARRAGWEAVFEPEALVLHDVTFPGYVWQVKRAWKQSAAAATALEEYPEIRRDLFKLRVFQRPRSVLWLAFVAGASIGTRRPAALLLALPYTWLRFPRYPHPRAVYDFGELIVFDGANVLGAFVAGLKRRKLIL
jgi:glycosyltransferase involved in cell wall biosynthesis